MERKSDKICDGNFTYVGLCNWCI